MNILVYSCKDFERPYLESANSTGYKLEYTSEALCFETAYLSKGFQAVCVFAGDDVSAPVIRELYDQGVRYIAVRATGYDNVDIKTANGLGIAVANVPAYSPNAIAEHAIALMLALNRKISMADHNVHRHDFTVDQLVGFDLNGKTVGIIGTGRIGSVMAKILHGFGCRLLGYDTLKNADLEFRYNLEYVNLPELCREADIITIHTGLTTATKYMINKEMISLMKKKVMLINTGRGACVSTIDVLEALESGCIGYYGADVYEKERGVFFYDWRDKTLHDDHLLRLLSLENVLLTPHQAFATTEALTNIADTTFYNIGCWEKGLHPDNELSIGGLVRTNESV
jgi:D-lactate dehydrogenase